MSSDPEFRDEVFRREIIKRDNEALLITAEERGTQIGIEKGTKIGIERGIKQGIKQGIEQGIEQGEKKKTIEIAKKLKELNMSIEKIMEINNLTKEEIEKI